MQDRVAPLLAEIRDFQAQDEQERAHQQAILKLLERPDFDSRRHYHPGHLTASAFVIDPSTARVLLHHHRYLDKWLQMGGHLEEGETPRQAALREAIEESGLRDLRLLIDGIVDLDVHQIPASKREPAHRHFDLRYLVSTERAAEISLADQESLSLRWCSLEEAAALMNEAGSSRALEKIRRLSPFR